MLPLAALIFLNFQGDPAEAWNGEPIPATPAFAGDATRRDTITADAAGYFAGFNVTLTQEPQPGAFEILIGGDGSWTNEPWAGISLVGAYLDPTMTKRSYVFPDVYGTNDPATGLAIAHELGHDFGLWHQLSGDSIMAPNPDGFVNPQWIDAENELNQPQNDVQVIGDAVGYSPEPSMLLVAGCGLFGMRRRGTRTH